MDTLNAFTIALTDPGDSAARRLIRAHLAHSSESTPQTSNHSMDSEALRGSGIRFWTLADETGDVVGCGALKPLHDGTVEVKSVHIAEVARGRGLARAMMGHLIEVARREGATAVVLETGSQDEYSPARGLYEALGFGYCDPIPGYGPDPNSVFMRLGLDPAGQTPQERPVRSLSSTG